MVQRLATAAVARDDDDLDRGTNLRFVRVTAMLGGGGGGGWWPRRCEPRQVVVQMSVALSWPSSNASVRAAWKNVVDCLLKLKRFKLLPPSVVDQDGGASAVSSSTERLGHRAKSESGVIFPSSHRGAGTSRHVSGMIGRFWQFLSLDAGGEPLLSQCRIGSIFTESEKLPDESVQNLGRALIFAGGGKGKKFSTPVEEEETVGFCWDLIVLVSSENVHRFTTFWPQLHDCFAVVSQLPLFSPCPFAEKAIVALFRIAVRLLSGGGSGDRMAEELVVTRFNYAACIEAAFGFAALKISPLDISTKILQLMADSVNWLIQWHKSGYSDPGNTWSSSSSFSSSVVAATMVMMEDASRMGNLATSMFIKLAEALRKTSLVRREEIRNQAVAKLS
uniref:Uncharacterized protein n=1 Tax=Oryza meridionalis TaxID=40149 RepID=A0A0E0D5D5_9ORYZ